MTCLTPGPRWHPPAGRPAAAAEAGAGPGPPKTTPGTASAGTASAAMAIPARSEVRRGAAAGLLAGPRAFGCCGMNPPVARRPVAAPDDHAGDGAGTGLTSGDVQGKPRTTLP